MRKLTSLLFTSLDGNVESPNQYVRADAFDDIAALIGETIVEQDAVLLGRVMYEQWSGYWPTSQIEPFATFINGTPKHVVSRTLDAVSWNRSSLLRGELVGAVRAMKAEPGKTIGVHGSIVLVQSLLRAGLLDELRFIQFPVLAGDGRRLFDRGAPPFQLRLQSSKATPTGLQYLVYTPHSWSSPSP